jgi:hypothetical protein
MFTMILIPILALIARRNTLLLLYTHRPGTDHVVLKFEYIPTMVFTQLQHIILVTYIYMYANACYVCTMLDHEILKEITLLWSKMSIMHVTDSNYTDSN